MVLRHRLAITLHYYPSVLPLKSYLSFTPATKLLCRNADILEMPPFKPIQCEARAQQALRPVAASQ